MLPVIVNTLAHRLIDRPANRDVGLGMIQYIFYVYSNLKLTGLLVISILKSIHNFYDPQQTGNYDKSFHFYFNTLFC